MTYLSIPDTRHGSLQYGAHWSIPGTSGIYIRFNQSQEWVQAIECQDLIWGTYRQMLADETESTVTLSEIREFVADAQTTTTEEEA
jgi:hypothetical protein